MDMPLPSPRSTGAKRFGGGSAAAPPQTRQPNTPKPKRIDLIAKLSSPSLASSIGRFVVAYALLIAPWPSLGHAFVERVGSMATAIADPFFASSNVTFALRAPQSSEHQPDWRGVIDVKRDLPEGPVRNAGAIDLRRVGYLQLAAFISLAAGWPPVGLRRGLGSVAAAMTVVSAVIAISIVDFLSDARVVALGPWLATAVSLARRTLVAAPGTAYAVPGLAWLAITRLPSPFDGCPER
jgi:hypothetical protein